MAILLKFGNFFSLLFHVLFICAMFAANSPKGSIRTRAKQVSFFLFSSEICENSRKTEKEKRFSLFVEWLCVCLYMLKQCSALAQGATDQQYLECGWGSSSTPPTHETTCKKKWKILWKNNKKPNFFFLPLSIFSSSDSIRLDSTMNVGETAGWWNYFAKAHMKQFLAFFMPISLQHESVDGEWATETSHKWIFLLLQLFVQHFSWVEMKNLRDSLTKL